jgi:hypothetical protein
MSLPRQEKFEPFERDEIYQLLSNHRRRHTIHFLKHVDDSTTLSDLAEQIAAWEQEKPVNELTSDERKRVYTSLQQTHLPRLADAGMITFEDGAVELTDRASELEVYLDIVPEGSIPWGVYYLGLSVISLAIVFGVWLEVGPTELVPDLAWATAIILMFLVSAVFHSLNNRRFRLGRSERQKWDRGNLKGGTRGMWRVEAPLDGVDGGGEVERRKGVNDREND